MIPRELGGKMVLIDIKVINAPLNYNIIIGRSYMYAMKVVSSSVFCTMIFPHDGKIFTLDQIAYYESHPTGNLDNDLHIIRANQPIPSYANMGVGFLKDSSLLGAY